MQIIPLGTPVLFITDNRIAHHGIVCATDYSKCVMPEDRPIVNLCVFSNRGYAMAKERVEPAKFNGIRWIILRKYALPGEVPEEEFEWPVVERKTSLY